MFNYNKLSVCNLKNQSGHIHFAILIITMVLLIGIITSQIPTTTNYPNRPEQVLGANSDSTFSATQTKDQITQEALSSHEIDSINQYSIIGQNNEIYTLTGSKTFHLLGVLPISMPVTVTISAESGNLLTKEQSVLSNLFQIISR